MSRAILTMALARTFHRTPTDAELTEFLAALREYGGERIYVPQQAPTDPAIVQRVHALRSDGCSIRCISKATSLSKSQVHRVLSQIPAFLGDTEAA